MAVQLNDNILDLLKKRYFLKDEKGNLLENTWEDICNRVATNIASAEETEELQKKYKKLYYDKMVNLEFIPSSPTLFNSGTSMQQLSSCFLGEQQILTSNGFKTIDNISKEDLVVTHKGRLCKVLKTSKREVNENIYNISVHKLYNETLKVTSEHPILAIKKEDIQCIRHKNNICNGKNKKVCYKEVKKYKTDCINLNKKFEPKWVQVKDLSVGDYVAITTLKEIKDINKIDLIKYVDINDVIYDNTTLKTIYRPNEGKLINRIINIDEDFMYIVGLYLGDGSVVHRNNEPKYVNFTINNIKDKYVEEKISKSMKKVFNISPSTHEYENMNTLQVSFHSVVLANIFKNMFGCKFDKKDIPEWVLKLPNNKLQKLLEGIMDSDGFGYSDVIYITMCNKNVIEKLWIILNKLGIYSNIKKLPIPKGGTSNPYTINYKPNNKLLNYIETKDYILYRIDSIDQIQYQGYVYNIEVNEDNTYVANGVIVHNCFIIDIEDNMESIAEAWKECSIVFKSGGGVGFNVSKLRPKGALVSTSNGEASGVVSFMTIFNQIVEIIKQGGRRKGALKIDLNDSHNEILDFIHCKDNIENLNNMNISVSISDEFMNALLNNDDWNLKFNEHIYQTIKAKDLWNEIIESAWKTGEPGISFRNIMDRDNKNPHLGRIVSSNPCQEFTNIPYASCNLGSINLEKVVKNNQIDYALLQENVRIAVRFLDDMITVNKLPLEKIDKVTKDIRPIGLGTIGYANMLFMLNIPYNSEEAYKLTDEVYEFIKHTAIKESMELAFEKGEYSAWKGSEWEKSNIKIRNCNHISIAPNGSIGFIADSTGGIEPEFALVYTRTTNEGAKYFIVNKIFKQKLEELGLYNNDLLKKISENNGSIKNIKEIPDDIKKVFTVSHDITPQEHLKTLSIVQKYVDLSISKTVNLPSDAKVEDVSKVYIEAWENNIKGITVYRDGSRQNQVLSTNDSESSEEEQNLFRGQVIPALEESCGRRLRLTTGCGHIWLMIFTDKNNNIIETFVNTGSKGGCTISTQAMSRLASLALRGGISLEDVIDQLESAGSCPAYQYARGKGVKVSSGKSCPSAIAKALTKYQKRIKENNYSDQPEYKIEKLNIENLKEIDMVNYDELIKNNVCPECMAELQNIGGCKECKNCGFSKCG